MKQLSKGLSVFTNLANYAAGIAVCCILIFKLDFTSIISSQKLMLTTNEHLFFNLIMFEAGLSLLALALLSFTKEYRKLSLVIEFPLFYEIFPVVFAGIGIFFALKADTTREKIFVFVASVLYAVLSAIIIYSGAAMFQIFPKSAEHEKENEE